MNQPSSFCVFCNYSRIDVLPKWFTKQLSAEYVKAIHDRGLPTLQNLRENKSVTYIKTGSENKFDRQDLIALLNKVAEGNNDTP